MTTSVDALEAAARQGRCSRTASRTLIHGLVRLGDLDVVAGSGTLASAIRFAGTEDPAVATAALCTGVVLAATVGGVVAVLYGLKAAEVLSRLWLGYLLIGAAAGLVWRLLVKPGVQ